MSLTAWKWVGKEMANFLSTPLSSPQLINGHGASVPTFTFRSLALSQGDPASHSSDGWISLSLRFLHGISGPETALSCAAKTTGVCPADEHPLTPGNPLDPPPRQKSAHPPGSLPPSWLCRGESPGRQGLLGASMWYNRGIEFGV